MICCIAHSLFFKYHSYDKANISSGNPWRRKKNMMLSIHPRLFQVEGWIPHLGAYYSVLVGTDEILLCIRENKLAYTPERSIVTLG